LERLGSMLTHARHPSEAPVLTSPFTLPAAFDYLDTVWQLKFGKPLIVPPGLERSARLVLDVATAEEADTALSALAEVLKNLNVPSVAPAPTSRPVPGNQPAPRGDANRIRIGEHLERRPAGAGQFSTCWRTTPGGESVQRPGTDLPGCRLAFGLEANPSSCRPLM
jgi:hypothetical protein